MLSSPSGSPPEKARRRYAGGLRRRCGPSAPCETLESFPYWRDRRCPPVVEELVALGVDVGRRDMSDLPRRAAQADSLVVDGGAHPDRTAILTHEGGTPETHVVPLPRVVPDRLLEGQILLATPEVEVADGGVV